MILLLALVFAAVPARADEAKAALFVRGFDEMALWRDGRSPEPVRRWVQGLRVRMTGTMASSYDELVMDRLNRIAANAGLTVAQAASDENFLVEFTETTGLVVAGRPAGCVAYTRWNGRNELINARLIINLRMGFGLRQCIIHELMHAVGFPGHPHTLDTVLSYVNKPEELTAIDEMSLRILYDKRLTAGMFHLPALLVARDVIAERLGIPPASARTLARDYLTGVVKTLTEAGEGGNVFAQAQLGNAYYFEHFVARDDEAAIGWWRRAAAQNHVDAQFRLGAAAEVGRGMPRDLGAAATWYRGAAERGHVAAMNALGLCYRDGSGVAADASQAYVWFHRAAERGNAQAKANRDALAASMAPEAIEGAKRRAADWAPAS